MRIYVAGPYTKGDVAVNVRAAIEAASELLYLGHTPFIPHLCHFWHLVSPQDYDVWMKWDMAWLPFCEAVLRIPGESDGADKECAWALAHGKTVYRTIEALAADLNQQ